MDDEEYEECFDTEIETLVVEYAPISFSWRTLAHNTLTHLGGVARVGADYLDSIAGQFGCSNAAWRQDKSAEDASSWAKQALSALDDL